MKTLNIIIVVMIVGSMLATGLLIDANKKQRAENKRLTYNQEVLNSNFESYKSAYKTGLKTIAGKDSIIQLNAAKIFALSYSVYELKQFSAQDVKTIAELKLKLKNVQSVTNVGTNTTSNIETRIVYVDSVKCLDYADRFTSVSGCFKGDSIDLKIEHRDSLTTIVSRVPAHRFLWWTWGVKAIELDIRAQNPDTKFTYLKYIEMK
jgi:hypothetical protein